MEEKLSIVKELIKLAKSDGELREIEFQFLWAIAQQLGVGKADFENLFHLNIAFIPPKFEADRIIQLHRLILVMNVDEEVSAEEKNKIREIGLKLGLMPLAIEEVFNEMVKHPNNMIPPDQLIKIFKVYHN